MKVTLLILAADPNNYTSADFLHAQSPLRLRLRTNNSLDHREEARVKLQELDDCDFLSDSPRVEQNVKLPTDVHLPISYKVQWGRRRKCSKSFIAYFVFVSIMSFSSFGSYRRNMYRQVISLFRCSLNVKSPHQCPIARCT